MGSKDLSLSVAVLAVTSACTPATSACERARKVSKEFRESPAGGPKFSHPPLQPIDRTALAKANADIDRVFTSVCERADEQTKGCLEPGFPIIRAYITQYEACEGIEHEPTCIRKANTQVRAALGECASAWEDLEGKAARASEPKP